MEQVTVVSPDYLARFGEPENLEDLAQHFAVDYVSSATGKPISPSFMVNGSELEVKMGSTISVTGADLYTPVAVSPPPNVSLRSTAVAHFANKTAPI
jgi:hypothetical protein